MPVYTIEVCNEPFGEGYGWEDCADDAPGARFIICKDATENDQNAIEVFIYRDEAEAWMKANT
jgi:hypothetical protein